MYFMVAHMNNFQDPNYIIIKRFIDENTQEALFYHTRQYRQQQASKGGLDIKIEEGNSASEYNKTGDHEVPRDEADSTEERDTNNDSPFWNLSADFVDIISKSSDMLASGVEYAQGAMEWNREDASNNSTVCFCLISLGTATRTKKKSK